MDLTQTAGFHGILIEHDVLYGILTIMIGLLFKLKTLKIHFLMLKFNISYFTSILRISDAQSWGNAHHILHIDDIPGALSWRNGHVIVNIAGFPGARSWGNVHDFLHITDIIAALVVIASDNLGIILSPKDFSRTIALIGVIVEKSK